MSLWTNRNWSPMLLNEVEKPFNDDNSIYEIKFDGIRAVIFASPNKVEVKSRNKKDLTFLFPELQQIKNIVNSNVIFDGEIVSMKDNKPSFEELQKRMHLKNKSKILSTSKTNPVVFISFDILYENKDIINSTLLERKKLLNKYKDNDIFIKIKYIEKNGIKLFNEIKKLDLEGIVAKKKYSLYYIDSRTDDFLKIKNILRDEFIIGAYIEKTNTFSLLLGEYENNHFHYRGKVVVGKQNPICQKLKEMEKTKNKFVDFSEEANYVKPVLTCFVEYLERTKNNHLRHPKFKEYK